MQIPQLHKSLLHKSKPSESTLSWTLKSLRNLNQMGFLTTKGVATAVKSIITHGPNLMVLLQFASAKTPQRLTLNEQYSYRQCYELALSLAVYFADIWQKLNQDRTFKKTSPRVAMICTNHSSSVLALFGLARLGADLSLINTEMSQTQLNQIINQKDYDMIICDDEFADNLTTAIIPKANTSGRNHSPYIISKQQIDRVIATRFETLTNFKDTKNSDVTLPRYASGAINVLTGGTSGRIKFANRKPSPFAMMIPFIALLNELELARYQSVYIAVPFYHGYGLASLIISVLLSARIFTSDKFKTETAALMIQKHQIEALLLVPAMLNRLLAYDLNKKDFTTAELKAGADKTSVFDSVKRIISGGAKLEASLTKQTLQHTGDTLFNLYGTSEAGFCVMATPTDLHRYPDSIGKAIKGVKLQLLPIEQADYDAKDLKSDRSRSIDGNVKAEENIGILSLRTAWSMDNSSNIKSKKSRSELSKFNKFISTGDLAYSNTEGYLFLKGRADDMIVSGGENVYPVDIENVLKQHPDVAQAAVIAVESEEFGKRLVAFVCFNNREEAIDNNETNIKCLNNELSDTHKKKIESQLKQWLKPKLARYQMPKQIILLKDFPITKTGKISHLKLKQYLTE